MIEVGKSIKEKNNTQSKENIFLAIGSAILAWVVGYIVGYVLTYLCVVFSIKAMKDINVKAYKKNPEAGRLIEAEIKKMSATALNHAKKAFNIIQKPLAEKLPKDKFNICSSAQPAEVFVQSKKYFPGWIVAAIGKRNKTMNMEQYMTMVCCGNMIRILKNIKKNKKFVNGTDNDINTIDFDYCLAGADNRIGQYTVGDVNTALKDVNNAYKSTFRYYGDYGLVQGDSSRSLMNESEMKIFVVESMVVDPEFIKKVYVLLNSKGQIPVSTESFDPMINFINTGKMD